METKTMNYEQKYKEALEKAKKWYNAPNSNKIPTYANRVIEEIFPELNESEDEKIRKAIIYGMETLKDQRKNTFNTIPIDSCINWLEKQGQSKKTSIWKHWKDGIAGNGEGKLTFLIKSGVTYSLSSCLSFECDYIELSELENLMLEKQDNLIDIANKEYWRGYKEGKQETLDKYSELEKQTVQDINIVWHNVSEEPEEQRELFCEWLGYADSIWHDVAFYHPSNKTFWNGEQQIENVVKWAYVDEIIEKQLQLYSKLKFKVGDTIQCVSDETDKRTIAEIDTLYNVYRCKNNYPIPFTQENMWKLESKFIEK